MGEHVDRKRRFTRAFPCPICGGGDNDPRGQGRRCYGFLSTDGYAHCTREEHAGGLAVESNGTYPHRLQGPCRCGKTHGEAPSRPHARARGAARAARRRLIATYAYRDATRTLRFEVCRYDPKGFNQRRPLLPTDDVEALRQAGINVEDGWVWSLKRADGSAIERVLFHLPELLAADPAAPIFAPEGEKDVLALERLGLVATCNPEGAGKWRDEYSGYLRDRRVIVLPDNDAEGRQHATEVRQALTGIARKVQVVALPGLPERGDVSNWLDAGRTVAELRALCDTPEARAEEPHCAAPESEQAEHATFKRLSDFLAESDEPVNWILEGLLPVGGLSLLIAKPKVGKSTLARYIAHCVARGVACLGRRVHVGPVLYISIEERRRDVRAHFAQLGNADDLDLHVHVGPVPGTPAGNKRDAIRRHRLAWLATEIKRLRPVLVVIDTWGRFVAVKDGNDYAEATDATDPVIALARETNTHLLFTHHAKKGDGELTDSVLGSTAIVGSVDTVLLERRQRDKVRTLESNQRVGDDLDELVLLLDKDGGTLRLAGTLENARLDELIRRILVRLVPERWITEKQLREGVDGRDGDVGHALREAVRRGLVIRKGEGKPNKPHLYARTGTRDERDDRDDGDKRDKRDDSFFSGSRPSRPSSPNSAPPPRGEPYDPEPPVRCGACGWTTFHRAGPPMDATATTTLPASRNVVTTTTSKPSDCSDPPTGCAHRPRSTRRTGQAKVTRE
jgi:hypothetical protein